MSFFDNLVQENLAISSNITCPICFSNEKEIYVTLPCNCSACATCLTQWLILKIPEHQYSIENQVTCILSECKQPCSLQAIYQRMPLPYQQKLDKTLLQVYLTKEPDIRKCPNQNCNYAGIITTTQSCASPLECGLCGTTWRDKQHYTRYENFLEWWRTKPTKTEEDSSQQWIRNKSKKCPSCRVNIEKNGGCDHMTCIKCQFEFCWVCSWDYPRHNKLKHITLKPLIPFLKIAIVLSILVFLIYLVGLLPALKLILKEVFSFVFLAVKWSFSPVLKFSVVFGSLYCSLRLYFYQSYPPITRKTKLRYLLVWSACCYNILSILA